MKIDPEAMRTHAGEASRLLKVLANEKRLQLLCLLVDGERNVGELNACLDLSQSAPVAKARPSTIHWRRVRRRTYWRPCTASIARPLGAGAPSRGYFLETCGFPGTYQRQGCSIAWLMPTRGPTTGEAGGATPSSSSA